MRFNKIILFCALLLIWVPNGFAQIKPSAMLLPIFFVDLDRSSLQSALNNYVQTELSTYYELKSEKEVEQARDAAIDGLSSENCTEEACVKAMGELLDVEYTFSLEIIDTGEGWDITAVRINMDGVTARDNVLCTQCNLAKARKALTKILVALRPGEMLVQRGKGSLILQSTPRAQVFLNGRDQGQTPINLSVDARVPLDLVLVAEGYNDFAEEFNLEPGEKRKKHIKLVRKRGHIKVSSTPLGAEIFINGKPEVDFEGKTLKTPSDFRLVFGSHELLLKLDKYRDFKQELNINRSVMGTKSFDMKPLPGRVMIRVPSEFKDAEIRIDQRYLGGMSGSIMKTFEVEALQNHRLQAIKGDFQSEIKIVYTEADGLEKIEFENFDESAQMKKEQKTSSKSSEGAISLGFIYENKIVTLDNWSYTKEITLSYTQTGLNLHYSNWKLEGLSGTGSISVKDSSSSSSSSSSTNYFYYSDGSTIEKVTGTKSSILRLMYLPKLGPSSYKKGWTGGIGYEISNIIFITEYAGDKTITFRHPVVDFGYQWDWPHFYISLKYNLPFAGLTDGTMTYSGGFSGGLGIVW